MTDYNNEDMGDVSELPQPPRHKTSIDAEVQELSNKLVEHLMEEEFIQLYLDLAPETFVFQLGEIVAMLLGSRAQKVQSSFTEGYLSGIEELAEMDVDQE